MLALARFTLSSRDRLVRILHCLLFTLGYSVAEIAHGVDTLPVGAMEPGGAGQVVGTDGPEESRISLGVGLHLVSPQLSLDAFQAEQRSEDTADKKLVQHSRKASLFFKGRVTPFFSLSLGLHGTVEKSDDEVRQTLFGDDRDEASRFDRFSAFSGATLLAKVKLLRSTDYGLSLAPFLETGVGEHATYSLTRSVHPKSGWMLVGTLGRRGSAEFAVNAGYRYRQPETLGPLVLRNELFLKTSVTAFVAKNVAFFATGDGQRLSIERRGSEDDRPMDMGDSSPKTLDATGGLMAEAGDAKVALFGGRRVHGPSAQPYIAGMNLTFALGDRPRRRGRSLADDVRTDLNDGAAADAEFLSPRGGKGGTAKSKNGDHGYTEMTESQIDPLNLFADENDDFKEIEKKIQAEKKGGKGPSELVEEELKKLELVEKRAEEARMRAERKAEKQRRAKERELAKEEREMLQEWMKEAQEEAAELEGITKQEMEWRGLE